MSFLWLFMHLHPKISAFVVITVPFLNFHTTFFGGAKSTHVCQLFRSVVDATLRNFFVRYI